MHEIAIRWNAQQYDSMLPITIDAYHARGGTLPTLPGRNVTGPGRADAHVAVDRTGEMYIFTKTDGMIRAVVAGVVK
jgi:hypothetical protein